MLFSLSVAFPALPLDIQTGLNGSDIEISSSHNVSDIPIEEERASSIQPSPLPSPRPDAKETFDLELDHTTYVELQPDSGGILEETGAASEAGAAGDSIDVGLKETGEFKFGVVLHWLAEDTIACPH